MALLAFLVFGTFAISQEAEERKLVSALLEAKSPDTCGEAAWELYQFYLKSNLLQQRATDDNLTIRLLSLWRFGKDREDKNTAKKIIEAIKQKTGSYPPKAFCNFIFFCFDTKLPDLPFNEGTVASAATIEKNAIKIGNEVICDEIEFDRVAKHIRYKQLLKKYKAAVFRYESYDIVICYVNPQWEDVIFLRDRKTGKIRWDNELFGCGSLPVSGPVAPRKIHCNVVGNYAYIFGLSGDVFLEQFQISDGKRVAAFATSNWGH